MSGTTIDVAACQAHVSAADYASVDSFTALLRRLGVRLDAARAALPGPRRPLVAVFPELIGAFLPLCGRARRLEGARTTDQAFQRVGRALWPRLAHVMWRHRLRSPKVALLVAVAPEVWAAYRRAFAGFARHHEAWVVAGSALLPRNAHGDLADAYAPADGRVYNTSYTFAPDGRLAGVTRKVNLVPTLEDVLGLSPGEATAVRPVATPFGGLGTLVCYDGFDEAHTGAEPRFCRLLGRLAGAGAQVVAHPSANPWPWLGPWVFAAPGEAQLRREQWRDEGVARQLAGLPHGPAPVVVTAHLVGQVLDSHFEGASQVLVRDADGLVRVVAEAPRFDASPAAEDVILARVSVGG